MNKTQTIRLSSDAPWHKESFDIFLSESLPQLLAQRLPLTGYSVRSLDEHTCSVTVSVNDVKVEYTVLQPNEQGLFIVEGKPFVVVPLASSENLDTAEIKCVGEQLYDHVEANLGEATGDLPWDEALVRAWLPLDAWISQVVTSNEMETDGRWATGQHLDTTNGISALTHLRRIVIPNIEKVIAPSQFGRVCPFETPEGPNIGHVFSVALGAVIRDGEIKVIDDRPEAGLGLIASMVPFLEHNEPNRQLFGVNMIRQWLIPADPEPALVQTGNEPDAPDIWCGRNLLTAFISWGAETFEDGILVSQSCAKRFDNIQVGDKISNRHGTKGVISRILPDDEMPHLPDGTPVDLVYSFFGIHTRLNFGQVREALMGRIAKAEGEIAIVPPFSAPDEAEIRECLCETGLPEDGMEFLTIGCAGKKMECPSAVGYVYWGRTVHTSSSKIHSCIDGPQCNRSGELEYYALRDMGCYENIQSFFNTCSNDRNDVEAFVKSVETGPVEQSEAPSPKFTQLQRRLSAAGIQVVGPTLLSGKADTSGSPDTLVGQCRTGVSDLLGKAGLSFEFSAPSGETLKLAQQIEHPWLPGKLIAEVGIFDELPEYLALAEANAKLERVLAEDAPESLKQKALVDLEARMRGFLDALVTPEQLRFGNKVMLSGRTVLAPGLDLRLDQVGIADEIAWTIFAPLVTKELGDKSQVEKRTDAAARALDKIMAQSWVVINRAPTMIPTALMAFHPVRITEPVIRLHPLVCYLMNADYDGDQAAVFLPITEAAQREAGEKLSLAGHLRRDPNLYDLKLLNHEMVWGLARLSLEHGGLDEITKLAGAPVAAPGGIVNRDTLADALREVMRRDGVESVIDALQRLMERGLQVAKESGASINPFIGSSLELPVVPEESDPEKWAEYIEEVTDIFQSRTDFDSLDIGPQLLAVKSGARGCIYHLLRLVGVSGFVEDAAGVRIPLRHGFRDGFTPKEIYAYVAGTREGLARISNDMVQSAYGVRSDRRPGGFGVMVRAMRAANPGKVFARAAASGERDPLTDLDSRLFVGLKP